MNKILIEPFIETLPKSYEAIPQSLFHSFKPIAQHINTQRPPYSEQYHAIKHRHKHQMQHGTDDDTVTFDTSNNLRK